MKKLPLLILALTFTAASCNSLFGGGTGNMGVFRSDDSGQSFREANTIDKKNTLNSTSVNSLAMAYNNSQVLYMGAAAGLYKSEDSGGNWKLLVTDILLGDVALDPTNPETIYAVGVSGDHGKIIKTVDAARSWQDKYTEPTTSNSVRSIAMDPINHLHIWAGLAAGELIQSFDGGDTWQVAIDLHDPIYRIRFGPNKNLYALTVNSGLFESRDTGKTFTNLTGTLTSGIINSNSNFSAVTKFLDLAFDNKQNGVLYLATEQGLVRTVDDGANWSYMQMPVRNEVLRTSAVAVNPKDSNNIYAAVGDTLFKSANGGVTWETKPITTGQEVRQILIDATSPNVIYLSLGVRK